MNAFERILRLRVGDKLAEDFVPSVEMMMAGWPPPANDNERPSGMMNYIEAEQQYMEWLATMSDDVRAIGVNFRPWNTYRLKTTGQHCYLQSFTESENGVTCRIVAWRPELGEALSSVMVFGIDPNDLEEIIPEGVTTQ